MRNLLRLSLLCFALFGSAAMAGERLIGKIIIPAGTTVTNVSTTGTPFVVPFSQKLTIWCDSAAFIAVDTTTPATATSGAQPVSALEKFPTSTGSQGSGAAVVVTVGSLPSALVSIFSASSATCYVSTRLGTE